MTNERKEDALAQLKHQILVSTIMFTLSSLLIIVLEVVRGLSLLVTILFLFSFVELLYNLKFLKEMKTFESPQKILIEFRIRITNSFLLAITAVLCSLFGINEIFVIGLLLYASTTEVRLNNEIIVANEKIYYRNRSLKRSRVYKKSWESNHYRFINYAVNDRKKRLMVKHEYLKYLNFSD